MTKSIFWCYWIILVRKWIYVNFDEYWLLNALGQRTSFELIDNVERVVNDRIDDWLMMLLCIDLSDPFDFLENGNGNGNGFNGKG